MSEDTKILITLLALFFVVFFVATFITAYKLEVIDKKIDKFVIKNNH